METGKRAHIGRVHFPVWAELIITAAVLAVLIFVVYRFNIPNPNMILIAGLVICSSLFGYAGGIPAGLIMLGYTLFFFSTSNDFVSFNEQNTRKVIVSLIGIVIDLVFVCELKRRRDAAFREIRGLTDLLSEDNRRLQEASKIDGLTQLYNRLALRLQYPSYTGLPVHVMMLDIDNFKQINDRFGHAAGDEALLETGRLLADCFGRKDCYRYGGDEFLVIVPHLSAAEFGEKLARLTHQRPRIAAKGQIIQISYSFGFIQAKVDSDHPLRDLIGAADERMYEAKRSGKEPIAAE